MQTRSHRAPGTGPRRIAARAGRPAGRRARAGRLLVLALVAALGAACAGGTESDAGAEFEDPASDPDAPGIEPEDADGASVTATLFALPPLEITNRRGYSYEITVATTHFTNEVLVADPGRARLLVEAEFDITVTNPIDDRPAPFPLPASAADAFRIDLLFPMDEGLAAELHELRTGRVDSGPGDAPRSLGAYDIGGSPFLRSIPSALGSSLADAGRSLLELEPGEVVVWEGWTVPFGAGPEVERAPSQSHGGGEYGWPEEDIASLAEVYAGEPAYVMLVIDAEPLDVWNCRWSGNRKLVHYYDIAASRWITPEQMPWGTNDCTPASWKLPSASAGDEA